MDRNLVSSIMLEERVAMYLQAIEYATAANDSTRRQELEKDIQTLMDLMERMSVGQMVTADRVPPLIAVHAQPGEPLYNPLEVLSARLADYHKALYYAEIEIGTDRNQIQSLQRGLQVIHKLQEKVLAGIPIRADEIPAPVHLPSEDEFVEDPKSVITERIALYYQALEDASEDSSRNKKEALQECITKMEQLLQRAEHNIPIFKKDLPISPPLGHKFRKQTEEYKATFELLTKMSGLSTRAAKLASARGEKEMEKKLLHNVKMLAQVLQDYEMGKPLDMSSCPYTLADIERLADQAGVPAIKHLQDLEVVRLRYEQYSIASARADKSDQKDLALQYMRIVKSLESILQSAETGEKNKIDLTLIPPPPPPVQHSHSIDEVSKTAARTHLNSKEEHLKLGHRGHGVSLAEELSAFLSDSSSTEDSSSQSESTSSCDSPLKSSSLLAQTRSPSKMSSSGFNPLYAVTHKASPEHKPPPEPISETKAYLASDRKQKGALHPHPPDMVPSRALKPLISFETPLQQTAQIQLQQQQHQQQQNYKKQMQQNSTEMLNNYHGNGVILKPVRLSNGFAQSSHQRNIHGSSSEITCIEILKYEKVQLEKENTEEATSIAQSLSRQMEEEKQRLRGGGYEAWLAYLGQVEGDVTNINCDMKLARESGRDELLSSLIIKKELAEHELAVMRKRLPELQLL